MQSEAMRRLKMTVFRPSRRAHYVVRWIDPRTHKRREETTGCSRQRDAYEVASDKAADLLRRTPKDMPWEEFCSTYEQLVLTQKAPRSIEPWHALKRRIAELSPITTLGEISTAWVSKFQAALRGEGLATNTVASYSARLRAALRWAVELELLERAPVVKVTIEDRPRSRAMTLEEFERMLRVAEQIEGEGPQLHRLLRGLWHSGLRIGEIAALSWNADASIRLEDSGKYPVVSMDAAANKSRRNRVRPILPEFWAICCESPIRKGLVFPVFDASGQRLGSGRLSELIARVGKAACVITNWQRGKSASAHDIRRAFAVRMDGRLTLAELQKWMGHSDVSTTLTYYHTADAEALASKLWRAGAGGAAGGAEGEAANRPDKGR